MGRFLVVGTGPLLEEQSSRIMSGQCLRTMHFARPMKERGHRLLLMTVPIPGASSAEGEARLEARRSTDGIRYNAFTTHNEATIVERLRRILERHAFDGAVGINAYPAYLLARAQPHIPFWADLNGWTMAEGQTHGAVVGHDADLDHFWRMEVATLLEADRFSAVSVRQCDALYGELALAGRLNRHTFAWQFACSVPNAVYAVYAALERTTATPPGLEQVTPQDSHVVLWSGGFNTWTDVELLAEGLARAMEKAPSLRFAATGGAIPGHDERTFERFRALVREKLPAGRAHLLGWVETQTVVALHARANLGLNIDSRNTETRFGARNRLTNMLGAGLPVLTTEGTEIAQWIASNKAGAVIPLANPDALAESLLESAQWPERWEARAVRARAMALREFAPEATLPGFLEWCGRPTRAPDRAGTTSPRGCPRDGEPEASLWARLKVDAQVQPLLIDRASLHRLRGKWPIRFWRKARELWKSR